MSHVSPYMTTILQSNLNTFYLHIHLQALQEVDEKLKVQLRIEFPEYVWASVCVGGWYVCLGCKAGTDIETIPFTRGGRGKGMVWMRMKNRLFGSIHLPFMSREGASYMKYIEEKCKKDGEQVMVMGDYNF